MRFLRNEYSGRLGVLMPQQRDLVFVEYCILLLCDHQVDDHDKQ